MDATRQIEQGLQELQSRRRQIGAAAEITAADRAAISRQLQLAQAPWSVALEWLKTDPDLVSLLRLLWPEILPPLIKGSDVSPVHHIAWVVRFMAQIATRELNAIDRRRSVLAALFHDVGIGDCLLPKVSEASLRRAAPDELPALRALGIRSRQEHMEFGVIRARALLERFGGSLFSPADVETILETIGTHDNSKIPLMDDVADRTWLLTPDPADWVKQCHWEADALWMLTMEGVAVDLDRDGTPWSPLAFQARRDFNLSLHRKIVDIYRAAYPSEDYQRFGFHEGTLYRSATGWALAQKLIVEQPVRPEAV